MFVYFFVGDSYDRAQIWQGYLLQFSCVVHHRALFAVGIRVTISKPISISAEKMF